jgi:hypothetical protein
VNASNYAAAVAAVTGSSGTKLITDGVNQNVFSDHLSDAATARLGPADASWTVLAGGFRVVLQLRLGHGEHPG